MRPSFLRSGATYLLLAASLVASMPACSDDEPSGTGGAGPGSGATGADGGNGATGGDAPGGNGGTGGGGIPGNYDCSAPEGAVPPLKLTEVATGLDQPMLIKGAPGDNERLYIIERPGRIRILK